MSIASAITAAQGRVANAYTAVSNMGGTLPATQNLTNLPTAIESIPTGGGGDTVMVRGVAGTELYDTDDKVILIPTGDLYSDYTATWGANNRSISGRYWENSGFGLLDYNVVQAILCPYGSNSVTPLFSQIKATWNSSYTDFSNVATSTASVTYPFYDVYYTNKYTFAFKSTELHWSMPRYSSLGLIDSEGVFRSFITFSSGFEGAASGYAGDAVDKFVKVSTRNLSPYIYYVNDSGSVSWVNTSVSNSIPSKYNGNWYIIKGNSNGIAALSDPSTPVYNCTGFFTYTDGWGIRFFDDSVDYFWEYCYQNGVNTWYFRKITKSDSGWSIANLPLVASAYFSSLQGGYLGPGFTEGTGNWRMRSKDHGTTVESFLVGGAFGYDSQGNGNKVAHFIFNKATDTVTRLPDVFLDIPDTYTECADLQVNWDLGLIAVTVAYFNSPDTTHHCAIYVKKLESMAGYYKYYAYPNKKQYYLNNSLTGFVTSNEGADALGNTVLEVSTVENPTDPPWSNVGIVFGMDIVVYKGVI